jgi:hypothetical protein
MNLKSQAPSSSLRREQPLSLGAKGQHQSDSDTNCPWTLPAQGHSSVQQLSKFI